MVKRALLVIDVQNEYITGNLKVTYPSNSLDHILQVIDVANQKDIPVILVRHTQAQQNTPIFRKGTPEWELYPEITKRPYELIIDKNLPGSFTGTELEAWLRDNQIDTVVISGYMTQMCCDTTARQAVHLGFNVEFLSDATGTLSFTNNAGQATDEELHRTTLVAQNSFISQVISSTDWIKNLDK